MQIYKITQFAQSKHIASINETGYEAVMKFRDIIGEGEYTADIAIPVVSSFREDLDGYLYCYVGIIAKPDTKSWRVARLYANIASGARYRMQSNNY